jgi:hypothetical protein
MLSIETTIPKLVEFLARGACSSGMLVGKIAYLASLELMSREQRHTRVMFNERGCRNVCGQATWGVA